MKNQIKTQALLTFLVLLFASCGEDNNFRLLNSGSQSAIVDPSTPGKKDPVCNPLGGAGEVGSIQANLWLGDNSIESFQDIKDKNQLISNQIYFSSLEVPSTSWDQGMVSKGGTVIKDKSDQPLLEWFGLELTSNIQLKDDQEPGYYTFASNTDDGFTMKIKVGDEYIENLYYDKQTAPHFHCFNTKHGNTAVAFRMTADTRLEMKATYFQGPRYHIALELYMKKVADLHESHEDSYEYHLKDKYCKVHKDYVILKPENYYMENAPEC